MEFPGGARWLDAVVAARRRGLTPVAVAGVWWECCCCGCGWGVLAPVATGVVKFEGSSDVKIVALEGEMMYLELRVVSIASFRPCPFTRMLA